MAFRVRRQRAVPFHAWSTPASGVPQAVDNDVVQRFSMRAESLDDHIDAVFDALEIKPAVEDVVELIADEPPEPDEELDTFDGPAVHDDAAAAFAPEPTVTTVDDADVSPVDELAEFLASDEMTPPPRQRTARGSRHHFAQRCDRRDPPRRPISHLTPVTRVSRPMRARTPS